MCRLEQRVGPTAHAFERFTQTRRRIFGWLVLFVSRGLRNTLLRNFFLPPLFLCAPSRADNPHQRILVSQPVKEDSPYQRPRIRRAFSLGTYRVRSTAF